MIKNAIFASVLFLALALSFSVGKSYGLKNAPEYVALKERKDLEYQAQLDAWDAAYDGSPDQFCEQMIEIAKDYLADDLEPPNTN